MRRSGALLAAGAILSLLLVTGALAKQTQRYDNPSAQRGIEAASKMIGARVESPQGNDLGTVSDLALDPENGQVVYVILSRGKVLGVGGKLYPVPWHVARYNNTNNHFVVDLSQAQFDSAPSFGHDSWPDLSSSDWRQRVQSFYQKEGVEGSEGRMRSTEAEGAANGPFVRASKLMDKGVQNPQGQRIADMEDLAVNLDNGKVEYAVVGAGGGFLGMGEKRHAVPWQSLRYEPSHQTFSLNATKQKIADSPSFKSGEWPDMSDPAWQSQIDRYYGVQGPEGRFHGESMKQGPSEGGGRMQQD